MADEAVSVGVDVAKSSLDVAVSNSTEVRRFANDEDGVSSAAGYIAATNPISIIVEATSGLEMNLVAVLQSACLPVAIINPHQVRDFARATGMLTKTDAMEARILPLFGIRIKPEIRSLPDKEAREMGRLLTRRRQLVEMLTAERNRLLQADDDIRRGIDPHINQQCVNLPKRYLSSYGVNVRRKWAVVDLNH